MEGDLTKIQILEGGYKYPKNLIKLVYTKHVMERFVERSVGLDWMPTTVRITPDNIFSGRPNYRGELTSMVIKLQYSLSKRLYICLNPYDGGTKSMWFRYDRKTRNKPSKLYNKQAVRNDRGENNI